MLKCVVDMTRYAEGTTVGIERSRAEVEAILKRYGANRFMYVADGDVVTLAFEMNQYTCKLTVQPPARSMFTRTKTGRSRSTKVADDAWEAEDRRRWRVLVLSLKARLESIAAEAETFEQAFSGLFLLQSGNTLGETLKASPHLLHLTGISGLLAAPDAEGH